MLCLISLSIQAAWTHCGPQLASSIHIHDDFTLPQILGYILVMHMLLCTPTCFFCFPLYILVELHSLCLGRVHILCESLQQNYFSQGNVATYIYLIYARWKYMKIALVVIRFPLSTLPLCPRRRLWCNVLCAAYVKTTWVWSMQTQL